MVGRPVPTGKFRIRGASGKITLLRVHDAGTGYGPKKDFLDAEAIITLNTLPGQAFGFQLRQDGQLPARQGMLQLLLEALRNKRTVGIAYTHWYKYSTSKYDPAEKNHQLTRVWLKGP